MHLFCKQNKKVNTTRQLSWCPHPSATSHLPSYKPLANFSIIGLSLTCRFCLWDQNTNVEFTFCPSILTTSSYSYIYLNTVSASINNAASWIICASLKIRLVKESVLWNIFLDRMRKFAQNLNRIRTKQNIKMKIRMLHELYWSGYDTKWSTHWGR